MEQIFLNTRCHFSTPIRFWLRGIPSIISLKRFSRCGGKYSIMLTMSITHPRRTWQVDHIQSSSIIFFNDRTSLRLAKSPESHAWNTFSRAWNKVLHTRFHLWADPWNIPKKLSTKNVNVGGQICVGPPQEWVPSQPCQCRMESWRFIPDNGLRHAIQIMQ